MCHLFSSGAQRGSAREGSDSEGVSSYRDKLGEATQSYIRYIETLPEQERKDFLARRAPWHIRAKFIAGTIFTMLFRRSNHSKRRNNFSSMIRQSGLPRNIFR